MARPQFDTDEQAPWLVRIPDLNDQQFAQWAQLLEQRIGVVVPMERKSFLNTGLKLRMQEIGCRDYQEYYQQLVAKSGAQEWSTLVDRLTVHETRFFRHIPSLELVKKLVLPKQRPPEGCSHTFQVWSVGCATGEETYTLAMVIDEHFTELGCPYFFGITGTDVSKPALETARKGIYSQRRLKDISLPLQTRYCQRSEDGTFQIHQALRNRVCFSQLNVMEADAAPYCKMDLIYCQNLLIYFERERRERIVSQLAQHLRPGGVLVVGPGEVVGWEHPAMERVRYQDTLAFRRKPA